MDPGNLYRESRPGDVAGGMFGAAPAPAFGGNFGSPGLEMVGFSWKDLLDYGCVSKPLIIDLSGMNTHLPSILMFTRGTGF